MLHGMVSLARRIVPREIVSQLRGMAFRAARQARAKEIVMSGCSVGGLADSVLLSTVTPSVPWRALSCGSRRIAHRYLPPLRRAFFFLESIFID
jgi:hypothetical protein